MSDTRPGLATCFRQRFELEARKAMALHGAFACALPGGSVANAFLPALLDATIEWWGIDVFWVDERAVPATDPASNYGLARRLLLDHVPVEPARVHPMHGDAADLDAAAAAYAGELARTQRGRPLDFVLLGMGPEGHVCSLFPDHPGLEEPTRTVLPIDDSPKPPSRRLTLTLPALAGAAFVCVAAFGANKAAAVREALESPASRLPVALAARAGRRVLFLLDAAAASRLPPR